MYTAGPPVSCVLRIARSVAYCVSHMRIAYYVFVSNYRAIGIYTYGGCFTTITRLVCKNSAISAHISPFRPPASVSRGDAGPSLASVGVAYNGTRTCEPLVRVKGRLGIIFE